MIELGLQRISKLLARTPLPWRAIHVAGTNGKGSVCAYISEMLNTYNRSSFRTHVGDSILRHGRFTSPHVADRWDCITLNEGDEMKVVHSELFREIEHRVLSRNKDLEINASEFELLTATAFEIFTHSKLDVAVIETGMGGRLDATNVIGQPIPDDTGPPPNVDKGQLHPPPLVTAITKVGLDHQGFLGDTNEAIAREKAGIFKPGVPVVYDASNQPSVCAVLESEATARSSPYPIPARPRQKTELEHRDQNCSVALSTTLLALQALDRIPMDSSEDDEAFNTLLDELASAPDRVHFPGRLEPVDIGPLIGAEQHLALLDGAHNAQSAEVLAQATSLLRQKGHAQGQQKALTWVLAASDSKEVSEILTPLLLSGDSIFAVEFGPVDGMPWVSPMTASSILKAAKETTSGNLVVEQDYGGDVLGALKAASKHSVEHTASNMVIAGSLYLVGDVHRLLRDAKRNQGAATPFTSTAWSSVAKQP